VGVIARCVLDSGGLSGALTDSDFAARAFLKHAPVELYRQKLSDLLWEFVPLAAPDLATLALRFAISHPAITALTVGMQTKAQVDSAMAAIDQGALPVEVVDRIRRRHVWTKNFYELLG
jgi:aryl-alcohol dehydrogenase-like predicted oxidoreductase